MPTKMLSLFLEILALNKFRIITKIPKKDKVSISYSEWMEKKLEESLNRLKLESYLLFAFTFS